MQTLLTNTWYSADISKPWLGRLVLCLFSDGHHAVAAWNGAYWVSQQGIRIDRVNTVTHFYIFERLTDNSY
ncbi:MAG: hypothetical protein IKJ78_06040 [Bacteroidales bacterium]|nr:hypothetical protein [Bacteroidales bacterium]